MCRRSSKSLFYKLSSPEHVDHVAKPQMFNLNIGVKATICDSSCLEPVLEDSHGDVINHRIQRASYRRETSILGYIIVDLNVGSLKQASSNSMVNSTYIQDEQYRRCV